MARKKKKTVGVYTDKKTRKKRPITESTSEEAITKIIPSKKELRVAPRNTQNKAKKGKLKEEKPFKMKKTRKKEILGVIVSKDTEETECSHFPSELDEEKGTTVKGNANNGLFGIGGSLTNKRKSKMKFTQRATKKLTNKKRAYV